MTAATAAPGGTKKRWKLIVGAVVIAAAAAWLLLYVTVGGDFYMTVGEVTSATEVDNVRVGGQVVPDSVVQEGTGARFSIRDESGVLEVVYVGVFPERLRSYEYVVASGSATTGGAFEATEVLVKCPDKLFPEKATNGILGGIGLERLLY
ncbi:MAG: cytochrome c maturation protein CcmE domain-containing protein [Thermoleophilia bacterium]